MSVLLGIGKRKAILRCGVWFSSDLALERRLNASTSEWIRTTGGPALSDSDQERTVAREMAKQVGGRILVHLKSALPDSSEHFLKQRQMTLTFDSYLAVTQRGSAKPRSRKPRA